MIDHGTTQWSQVFYLDVYRTRFAFNIGWHEKPMREISSRVEPKGWLTKPGMGNHAGSHEEWWLEIMSQLGRLRGLGSGAPLGRLSPFHAELTIGARAF